MKNILKLIPIFIITFVFAHQVQAASVYLAPSSGTYFVGDRFSVSVLVSSSDQSINAVSADISFSQDNLELLSISQSGSIIGFWAQEPVHSNQSGTASLEGVVLNGYQGTSGKIVTLSFRASSSGEANINFPSGLVLANDGLGTKISSSFGSAKFNIRTPIKKTETPVTEFDIPENIPKGFIFTKDLNVPDKDIEVAYLQLCLQQEKTYSGDITGIFDSITKDAVIEYQEKYSKDILELWGSTEGTGLVRETTRNQLNVSCFMIPEEELVIPLPDIDLGIKDDVETVKKTTERVSFTLDIQYLILLVIFLVIIIILLFIIILLLINKQKHQVKEKENVLSDIKKRLNTINKSPILSKTDRALLRRLQADLLELEKKTKMNKKIEKSSLNKTVTKKNVVNKKYLAEPAPSINNVSKTRTLNNGARNSINTNKFNNDRKLDNNNRGPNNPSNTPRLPRNNNPKTVALVVREKRGGYKKEEFPIKENKKRM